MSGSSVLENMEIVKKKFDLLQKRVSDLNNKKISLESEVKTIHEDVEEQLGELLKLTGKTTFEESVEYFHSLREELLNLVSDVERDIDQYLKDSEDVSKEDSDSMFN